MRSAPEDWRHDPDPRVFEGGGAANYNWTRKLLWANGIVFVLLFFAWKFANPAFVLVERWLGLNPDLWYGGIPAVWQLVTYGFLHSVDDPFHLLFNMLVLYFFGTMLESQVGSRRFAWQYGAALAFGAAVHLAVAPFLGPDGGSNPLVVGASGAVLYTIVACAVLTPNARVIFFFVPLPLKVMALVLVGLDVFSLMRASGRSGTASDVHLAGAALGFVAARAGWIWFDPLAWWRKRKVQQVREVEASDEQRLDKLLERIHREGIGSLSQRDKDFLSRMSKRG